MAQITLKTYSLVRIRGWRAPRTRYYAGQPRTIRPRRTHSFFHKVLIDEDLCAEVEQEAYQRLSKTARRGYQALIEQIKIVALQVPRDTFTPMPKRRMVEVKANMNESI
jgi:hypothetical protein